jgi:hypothetical protein
MNRSRPWIAFAGAIALASFGPAAHAGVTGGALNIKAVSLSGDEATLHIPLPEGESPWVWSSTERIEMRSPVTGDIIAVLNPENEESRVEYIDDPVVGVFFSVQAGLVDTQFQISSAVLAFPLMNAEGRASAGFSITDFNGDGADLTGIGDPNGTQGAYLAQYNGNAGTLSGTTFAEVVQFLTAGEFGSASTSQDVPVVGFQAIPDPVSDISVLVSFTLSAQDLASGTSTFVVQVPPVSVEAATWGGIKALYR